MIDSPETSTVDDPDALRPAHSANIATWQELSDDDREPVLIGERQRHVRRHPRPGHLRLRRPGHPDPAARRHPAALRLVLRRGRRHASARALASADGPGYHDAVEKVVVDRGELTLFVRREHLARGGPRACATSPGCASRCAPASPACTTPARQGRELHAVYHLLSITHGSRRVRLEVTAPDADPHIPSIVSVYPGNDWHERETWDMFGIVFDGHPALTRILMPDDWPGHPQRKDYPLGGIPVEYKGGTVPPPDERRAYS